VEQLIAPPAIQFKGSGWYVTDYAGKSGAASGETGAEKPAAESKEGASKEASAKDTSSKDKKPAKKK
jgi:hypothetical protein